MFWTHPASLLCRLHAFEVFTPSRRVFFAQAAGGSGSSGGSGRDDDEDKKKPKSALESLTGDTEASIKKIAFSEGMNDLEKKLAKAKEDHRISDGLYKRALAGAKSGRFLDRALALRLAEGSVSSWRFNKLHECLHPESGSAEERGPREKLAELELTGKISPDLFDKLVEALDSRSKRHKNAAAQFIKNPKNPEAFLQFMARNPLKKAKLAEMFGVPDYEFESGNTRKELRGFTEVEVNEYMTQKLDTREGAEIVRKKMETFHADSAAHAKNWDEIEKIIDEKIAIGGTEKENMSVSNLIAQALSESFPSEAIHQNERRITRSDLETSIQRVELETGISLMDRIPPDILSVLTEKMQRAQELQQRADATMEEIRKETEIRNAAIARKINIKKDSDTVVKSGGISIKPGTKIRYKMPVASEDGSTLEYRWHETEIKGVYFDKIEEENTEFHDENFRNEETPLVIVTGAGTFNFSRFVKWVNDTEASQVINSASALEKELEWDLMELPIKEGMELEYRMKKSAKNDDFSRHIIKIQKLHSDGSIELENEVDYIKPGAVVENRLTEKPIKKKHFTAGEFARFARRFSVLPRLESVTEAQEAYNKWKKAKGSHEEVSFQKNKFITWGPYEAENRKLITDIIDDGHGNTTAKIDGVVYPPHDLLLTGMSNNWEQEDPETLARSRCALLADPAQKAAAIKNEQAKILRMQADYAAKLGDKDLAAHLMNAALALDPEGTKEFKEKKKEIKDAKDAPGGGNINGGGNGNNNGNNNGSGGNGSNNGNNHSHHDSNNHGSDHGDHGGGGGDGGSYGSSDSYDGGKDGHPKHPTIEEIKEAIQNPHSSSIPQFPSRDGQTKEERDQEDDETAKKELEELAKMHKNTSVENQGYIQELWHDTHFLTVQDMWQLAKHIWEYWERTWERRMKKRFSKFGANLPWIGAEMLRVKEETEHHEVSKYKEAIGSMGIVEVRGIMNRSSNLDQIKACIEVLVEKGQMRWDDVRTWEALNRISDLPNDKKIPIPKDKNPYAIVRIDPKTKKKLTGMHVLKDAIDALWGDNYFDKWKTDNINKYQSSCKDYDKEGDELENDPYDNGGVSARLQILLDMHMKGEYVDPHEYEGLLRFIITKGKSTVERKLYYIVMGVATRLMTLERIGALDGEYLNILPWLDFFTDKESAKPFQKGKPGPYTLDQLREFAAWLDTPEGDESKPKAAPGQRAKNILWDVILVHKKVFDRTYKGTRNAENMDHDDSHFIIPLLDDKGIITACGRSTGNKKYFSTPGYLNAYAGFSEWLKRLAGSTHDQTKTQEEKEALKKEHKRKLMQAVKAYVTYDGILSERFRKGNNDLARISPDILEQRSVVDAYPVRTHQQQLKKLILAIGQAYGKDWSIMFEQTKSTVDPKEKARQEKIEQAIENFTTELDQLVEEQGEDKLFNVIHEHNLLGYHYEADSNSIKKAQASIERATEKAAMAAP